MSNDFINQFNQPPAGLARFKADEASPEQIQEQLLEGAAKAVLDRIERVSDELALATAKSLALGFVLGLKGANLPADGDRYDAQFNAALSAKEKALRP